MRWWVLVLLFSVTVINFVDRQALSVLAPIIRETFHLSNTQYGTIVSWFQFGMVVGEFPMGWLMVGILILFLALGDYRPVRRGGDASR